MEDTKGAHPQRLLLRVPEAAQVLGLGRSKVYSMIGEGAFPVVRAGRALRISWAALQKWVQEQEGSDSAAG